MPKAGVSFVEVAIAILILGLVVLPIMSVFEKGAAGTMQTRGEMLAFNFAADLAGYVKAVPFDDIMLKAVATAIEVRQHPWGGPVDPRFKRTIRVEDFHPNPTWPFLYKIATIEVLWGISGPPRTIVLRVLRFRERLP